MIGHKNDTIFEFFCGFKRKITIHQEQQGENNGK